MSTPDGGLWISFQPSGVGFLKDGRFVFFEQPRFELASFARDLDGRIWAGTRTGLLLFEGGKWVEVAENWNFTGHRVWTMLVDRSGTLWVAGDDTFSFLHRGSRIFQQTGIQLTGVGVARIVQAPDGRLWFSRFNDWLRVMDEDGRILESPGLMLTPTKFLFDRDGSLWMGTRLGVCRLRFPERLGHKGARIQGSDMEWFTESEGLPDNGVNNILEDREGNIWISSDKGLNLFRHSHLVPVMLPSGHRNSTLMAGDEGDVWVGSNFLFPFLRIHGGKVFSSNPPAEISSVYRESQSTVWWGGVGGVWRQQNDHFEFFPQPRQFAAAWDWEVFPDDLNGGLWVGAGDFGLIHFRDGIWTFPTKPEGLPDLVPSASFHDSEGRTWLGYQGNRVVRLTQGQVRVYSHEDGLDVGRIRVIRGYGAQMVFGGDLGLAVFEEGRFTTIRTDEDHSFGAVTGIVETTDGALWLNEQNGIVRVSPFDVLQVGRDPKHVVLPEVYGFLDGLPGAPQIEIRSSTAVQATDGRLWFATDGGLVWVDPLHILKNMVPPPVSITALSSGSAKYALSESLRLPQGTTALRIEYAALSLSIPERVRFKYELRGVDKDWHEAGTRREAVYNNVGPGQYEFRVIAANNDSLWNEQGSRLTFSIAPAWFQTIWFRLLCVVAFGLAAWAIYQLRVRQMERQFNVGLEERVGERTRIARELHDTLLQNLHALMFQFQSAINMLPQRPGDAKQTLEGAVSDTEQAITESQNAIEDLRSELVLQRDFVELLTALGDELKQGGQNSGGNSPVFHVIVEGERQSLLPQIQDEVYRIAREVLRNAFRHANANKIEAEIRYDAGEFRLRIRDDGKGITPIVLEEGKRAGHWGLPGIKERARRIGAKLDVLSEAGAGTEVQLILRAARAYEAGRDRTGFRLFRKASSHEQRS